MLLFLIDEFLECAAVKVEKTHKLQQRTFDCGNNLISRDIRKAHRKLEEQMFKF